MERDEEEIRRLVATWMSATKAGAGDSLNLGASPWAR